MLELYVHHVFKSSRSEVFRELGVANIAAHESSRLSVPSVGRGTYHVVESQGADSFARNVSVSNSTRRGSTASSIHSVGGALDSAGTWTWPGVVLESGQNGS